MKKVFPLTLIICLLFLYSPLLAQKSKGTGGQKVFEVIQNPNHYMHVLSADKQSSLATLKYPPYIFRMALLPNKILMGSNNLNIKGFAHVDFFGGGAVRQSLSPSLTIQNQEDFRDSTSGALRLNIGVNLNYYLFRKSKFPFRFFGGIKYRFPFLVDDGTLDFTSSTNATAECIASVANAKLDPSISWRDATAGCTAIRSKERWLSFMVHYGVTWQIMRSLQLSYYATNPLDYSTGNYTIREESTINLGLGWVY